MPSRRTLLRTAGLGLVPFAGCANRSGSPAATGTSTQSKAGRGTSASTSFSGPQALPPLYFSEILSNPEGEDSKKLNEEYVLIEMHAEGQLDVSNYTLEYGGRHHYSLPNLISEIETGASLVIRSGSGENRVEGSEHPDYLLFVGSEEPLLDNYGMQLKLRDNREEVVDSVTFGKMEEGTLWVRPE